MQVAVFLGFLCFWGILGTSVTLAFKNGPRSGVFGMPENAVANGRRLIRCREHIWGHILGTVCIFLYVAGCFLLWCFVWVGGNYNLFDKVGFFITPFRLRLVGNYNLFDKER